MYHEYPLKVTIALAPSSTSHLHCDLAFHRENDGSIENEPRCQ